jgi:hypothetical protein
MTEECCYIPENIQVMVVHDDNGEHPIYVSKCKACGEFTRMPPFLAHIFDHIVCKINRLLLFLQFPNSLREIPRENDLIFFPSIRSNLEAYITNRRYINDH